MSHNHLTQAEAIVVLEQARCGDVSARNRLIDSLRGLIYKKAIVISGNTGIEADELVSVAVVQLVRAIGGDLDRYDPARGAVTTYYGKAAWQAMRDYAANSNGGVVHVPRNAVRNKATRQRALLSMRQEMRSLSAFVNEGGRANFLPSCLMSGEEAEPLNALIAAEQRRLRRLALSYAVSVLPCGLRQLFYELYAGNQPDDIAVRDNRPRKELARDIKRLTYQLRRDVKEFLKLYEKRHGRQRIEAERQAALHKNRRQRRLCC